MGGSGHGLDHQADGEPRPQERRCPSCKVAAKPGEWMRHMAGCPFDPPVKMTLPPPESDL